MPPKPNSVVAQDIDEIIDRELPWSELRGAAVLVTGAAGMLPSYVVRALLALNDRHGLGITVHGLVRNLAKARQALFDVIGRPDFTLLVGDVSDPVELPARLDWIIHGASPARPGLHGADPIGTMRANLLGTMNLLEACRLRPGAGILLMSSAEVYGVVSDSIGLVTETDYGALDPLNTRSCYPESKRASETLARSYAQQHGVTCRIVRFGHVYGPGLAIDDGRVQADFAAHAATGTDIVLNSDGSAVRTYTYVADAVTGLFYVLLLGDDLAYNVADERGLVSIRELAEHFARTRPDRGLRVRTRPGPDGRSTSTVRRQGLSSARLAGLGWEPCVDLPAGIDRMVTALEAHLGSRVSAPAGATERSS